MTIDRENVAKKLIDYLQHQIALNQLVDWAETAVMRGQFEGADRDNVMDIVARLGLADVRAFGLTWEDCETFLNRLGYDAKVDVVAR